MMQTKKDWERQQEQTNRLKESRTALRDKDEGKPIAWTPSVIPIQNTLSGQCGPLYHGDALHI